MCQATENHDLDSLKRWWGKPTFSGERIRSEERQSVIFEHQTNIGFHAICFHLEVVIIPSIIQGIIPSYPREKIKANYSPPPLFPLSIQPDKQSSLYFCLSYPSLSPFFSGYWFPFSIILLLNFAGPEPTFMQEEEKWKTKYWPFEGRVSKIYMFFQLEHV